MDAGEQKILQRHLAKFLVNEVFNIITEDDILKIEGKNWTYKGEVFSEAKMKALQSQAKGFTKKVLDRTDFSEDNRKFNHVSGFVGINVDANEKEKGLCRLNWIMNRNKPYNVYRCCHCRTASCFRVEGRKAV